MPTRPPARPARPARPSGRPAARPAARRKRTAPRPGPASAGDRAAAPRATTPVGPGGPPLPPRPGARHLEVLREALALFGERGYRGASLRELARRLGISQPSLYHWVQSKEQLVEQIIVHLGSELLAAPPSSPAPRGLDEVPRFIVETVFEVWRRTEYAGFVRFLFAIAIELPHLGPRIRGLYDGGVAFGTQLICGGFIAAGEIAEDEARHLVRLCASAIGLRFIEEQLLYGERAPSAELRAFADATVRLLEDALRARARARRR